MEIPLKVHQALNKVHPVKLYPILRLYPSVKVKPGISRWTIKYHVFLLEFTSSYRKSSKIRMDSTDNINNLVQLGCLSEYPQSTFIYVNSK